jgi:aconitate hydratase
MLSSAKSEFFKQQYANVFDGDERWRDLMVPAGDRFVWDEHSTYVRKPPFVEGIGKEPAPLTHIRDARVLALLGDSVTTDHISPAGSIPKDSPAGKYLIALGVNPPDFNSYGARRGNHEVMVRGTFANIRLRNQLAPGTEGGWTLYLSSYNAATASPDAAPGGELMSIYDASVRYQAAGVPLIVLAGKEYGSGSSRDWAAKGTLLLGVRAVIAESFERIHRSNLVNMGVLPLQFKEGESAAALKLTGHEVYDIAVADLKPRSMINVRVQPLQGSAYVIEAAVRIDTPEELTAFRHGGILPYVLRQLLEKA